MVRVVCIEKIYELTNCLKNGRESRGCAKLAAHWIEILWDEIQKFIRR